MTFLGDDIATTESLASDITTLADVEVRGEVPAVSQEHDRLPSVEEEDKAKQISTKVLGTTEIGQADNNHDQLPKNNEDYNADRGGITSISSGKKTLRCLGIALAVLVAMVVIVVVPLVLVANNRNGNGNGNGNGSNSGSPSSSPSRSPSSSLSRSQSSSESRIPAVADYLEALDIATMDDMRFEGSPQNRALKWIADDDEYQLALPDTTSADSFGGVRHVQAVYPTRNPFVERYSLAVFYYSLGGPRWDYQLQFLAPTDHCEWHQNFNTTSGTIIRWGVNECKEIQNYDVSYVLTIEMRKLNKLKCGDQLV
jgi:hypothetical protein